MIPKMKIHMNLLQKLSLLLTLLLSAAGFLVQWLLYENGFWEAAAEVVLPAIPAVILFLLEYHTRMIARTAQTLKGVPFLTTAMPLLFVFLGAVLHFCGWNFSYSWNGLPPACWVLGFAICAHYIHVCLHRSSDASCSALLLCFLLFFQITWRLNRSASTPLVIGILAYVFTMALMNAYYEKASEENSAAPYMILFVTLGIFLMSYSEGILDRLFFDSISRKDEKVFHACKVLRHCLESGVPMSNMLPELADLRCYYPLGYLTATAGVESAIVVIALMVVLLIVSGILVRGDHRQTPLSLGCWYLLFLRAVGEILMFPYMDLELGRAFPFLYGSEWERVLDYILMALILMPLKAQTLADLDPADVDFAIREATALKLLPRNMDGLVQLCRYLYNFPSDQGWDCLEKDFKDLMDANTLRIMVLNADSVSETDYFRNTYPECFRTESSDLSEELPEKAAKALSHSAAGGSVPFYKSKDAVLERYLGNSRFLAIPPCWRSIGLEAFSGNDRLKAVSVPNTIRRICFGAFRECGKLATVQLRSGLEEIGAFAFAESALEKISLPDTLRILEKSAFSETNLEEVRIPGSVERISEFAFEKNEQLRTVVLEDGVKAICAGAFRDCPNLQEIRIPDSVSHIHPRAFAGCVSLCSVEASEEWKEKYPDLLLNCLDQADYEEE